VLPPELVAREGQNWTPMVGQIWKPIDSRSDALEKRRELMEAWANYCEPKTGNVVSIARRPR
jgi:hypothetical protein